MRKVTINQIKSLKNFITNLSRRKWFFILSFILIIVVALTLRLQEAISTEFWYDEIFTASVVKMDWDEMIQVVQEDKVHPILFYTIIKTITDYLGHSEFSVRLISIISGIGLVIVSYFISKQLFPRNSNQNNLLLPSLFAFSPYFVSYSAEARSYSLIAFLFSILMLMLLYLLNNHRRYWTVPLIILVSAILVNLHFLSIIYIFALLLSFIILFFFNKLTTIASMMRDYWIWLICSSIGIYVLFESSIFTFINNYFKNFDRSSFWWIPETNISGILSSFSKFILGVERGFLGVPPIINFSSTIPAEIWGLIFVLLSAYAVMEFPQKRKSIFFIFTSLILGYMAIYFAGMMDINFLLERYIIASGVLVIIILSIIIFSLKEKYRYLFIVLLFLFANFSLFSKQVIQNQVKHNLLSISDEVETEVLYFDDGMTFAIAKYYLPDVEFKLKIAEITDRDDYGTWALIEQDEVLKYKTFKISDLELMFTRNIHFYSETPYELIQDFGTYKLIRL